MGAQEFGVRDAANRAESFDDVAIDLEQRLRLRAIARERAGTENTALVRYIERRRTVGMGIGEDHFTLGYNAVHVEYRTGNELFQQVVRLLVSQLIEPRPQLIGLVDFLHADSGRLRAWFQQPGCGHAGHE